LYGSLAGGRSRASLRRGGIAELARRMRDGELTPDFGPAQPHPSAGAVLVGARPPLVAFNVELAAPATVADARAIAARIREGGPEGLPGVRALGLELTTQGAVAQVSTNVEDHRAVSLAQVVAAIARHAPVAACELVGLAPALAFAGFPQDVPVKGRRTVEDALHHEV
jgi:glutamate formiminotransferase